MTIRQFRRMFQPKVAKRVQPQKNGCWLWTGPVAKDGYAKVHYRLGGPATGAGRPRKDGSNIPKEPMRTWGLSRLIWTVIHGSIPPGMQVGHNCHDLDPECAGGPTCLHRRCCNPDHLSLQTHQMNTAMAMRYPRPRTHHVESAAKRFARRGTCDRGHDVSDPATIYTYPSGRTICRTCHYLAKYKRQPKRPYGPQPARGAA